MKTKYPIGLTDLRHQPDHITFKKTQLLQEYDTDPDNAALLLILVKQTEIKLISDGKDLIQFEVL